MCSTQTIKERIKRLYEIKKEYQGKDNGFFDSLIMSQEELLNNINAKQCKNCKHKGRSVFRNDGTEFIVCWNQGYGTLHPINWCCADFYPSDEAVENALNEDG